MNTFTQCAVCGQKCEDGSLCGTCAKTPSMRKLTDREVLDLATKIKHRQIMLAYGAYCRMLYGSKAAIFEISLQTEVDSHSGEYSRIKRVYVKDDHGDILQPDFSLPFWLDMAKEGGRVIAGKAVIPNDWVANIINELIDDSCLPIVVENIEHHLDEPETLPDVFVEDEPCNCKASQPT